MSRRTKLLITALFLVLLAIPAVYVVLTWHLSEPLRFTLVSHQSTQDKYGTSYRMELEGTNPSAAPVYIYYAYLIHPDSTRKNESPTLMPSVPSPVIREDRPPGSDFPAVIPSRGTARFFVSCDAEFADLLLKKGKGEIKSVSHTSTKFKTILWLDRVFLRLKGASNACPIKFTYEEDRTSFEVSMPIPLAVESR